MIIKKKTLINSDEGRANETFICLFWMHRPFNCFTARAASSSFRNLMEKKIFWLFLYEFFTLTKPKPSDTRLSLFLHSFTCSISPHVENNSFGLVFRNSIIFTVVLIELNFFFQILKWTLLEHPMPWVVQFSFQVVSNWRLNWFLTRHHHLVFWLLSLGLSQLRCSHSQKYIAPVLAVKGIDTILIIVNNRLIQTTKGKYRKNSTQNSELIYISKSLSEQ